MTFDIQKAPIHIHAIRPDREPDFKIGPDAENPYMLRWHLIPRNGMFNIYYHHVLHDDDDCALHDHPWPSFSYLIRGNIREVTPDGHRDLVPGDCVYREADAAHRLELLSESAETLFVTGPVIRDWGFHCPQGWKHWKDFVDPDNPGAPGRGCGEG